MVEANERCDEAMIEKDEGLVLRLQVLSQLAERVTDTKPRLVIELVEGAFSLVLTDEAGTANFRASAFILADALDTLYDRVRDSLMLRALSDLATVRDCEARYPVKAPPKEPHGSET